MSVAWRFVPIVASLLGDGFGPRIKPSKYLYVALVTASFFELGVNAKAQVDLNIQSRVQIYTTPLTGLASPAPDLNPHNLGACLTNPVFVQVLYLYKEGLLYTKGYLQLSPEVAALGNDTLDFKSSRLINYLRLKQNTALAADIITKFFDLDPNAAEDAINAVSDAVEKRDKPIHKIGEPQIGTRLKVKFIPPLPIGYCKAQPSIKLIVPFNPTYESNVLKSNAHDNNSPGASAGFGGTLQIVAPVPTAVGVRTFDVVGFSTQSQSVRYNQFSSKSFDALITQGAYQHFLSAVGYSSDGHRIDSITVNTPTADIPPLNMITVNSVAFGFQDQAVFTPGFRSETVDLFTPQITLNRQNQDLSFAGASCTPKTSDPRQQGFCYYADLSLTVGQTFSDVSIQENANLTVSATPGLRIESTDWKLTLPVVVTERAYEQVVGGRDDVLLQIGAALTYLPAPFYDRFGSAYAVAFSLPVTYNHNYSTLAAAAWHGYIIMPTLTVAFQPPPANVK